MGGGSSEDMEFGAGNCVFGFSNLMHIMRVLIRQLDGIVQYRNYIIPAVYIQDFRGVRLILMNVFGLNSIILVSFSSFSWKYTHAVLWGCVLMPTFGIVRIT